MRLLNKPLPLWLSLILIAITILALVRAASIELLYIIRGTAVVSFTDDVQIKEFRMVNSTHVQVTIAYVPEGEAPECTVWLTQGNLTAKVQVEYGWQPEKTVLVKFTPKSGILTIQVTTP